MLPGAAWGIKKEASYSHWLVQRNAKVLVLTFQNYITTEIAVPLLRLVAADLQHIGIKSNFLSYLTTAILAMVSLVCTRLKKIELEDGNDQGALLAMLQCTQGTLEFLRERFTLTLPKNGR
jgi:hypothetical protein